MSLLKVDPSQLLATARRIETALPVGHDVSSGGTLGAQAAAAGRGDVQGAISSFLDTWSYGIQLMNQDAQHLSSLLRLAGEAYGAAESKIGAAEQ